MTKYKSEETRPEDRRLSRRRFLGNAAAAGGAATLATLAGCGVGGDSSQPQSGAATGGGDTSLPEVRLKFQGAFSPKDPIFEIATEIFTFVEQLSGGRMTVEMLPAGAVVGAFDQADAVHKGILDGSQAVPAFWYGKNSALSLFGTGPAWGHDANTMLGWMEYGGGQELYEEIYRDLKLDVVPLAYGPMPTQPLGWFRKEIKSAAQFKGVKYRTVGLSIDVFKNMGASVVALPGGEIVPALERGVIDAAEYNNPASDMALGFPDVSKICMVQSYHQPAEFIEVLINRKVWEDFPEQYRAIWRVANKAANSQMYWRTMEVYSKAYEVLRDERNVKFIKTPDDVLELQLDAWDKIIEEKGAENPFFMKVIESQKAYMKRVLGYQTKFIVSRQQAYDHYFS